MAYAEGTGISETQTRADIERLVRKHGCEQYMCGSDYARGRAFVQFYAHGRLVKFVLTLPTESAPGKKYKVLSPEQRARSRWRALLLVIKGKLESVENQIATFEEEFMPYIVMPDGRTVAEHIVPAIEAAYKDGKVQRLLPEWSGDK